jgi:hypothetical protein
MFLQWGATPCGGTTQGRRDDRDRGAAGADTRVIEKRVNAASVAERDAIIRPGPSAVGATSSCLAQRRHRSRRSLLWSTRDDDQATVAARPVGARIGSFGRSSSNLLNYPRNLREFSSYGYKSNDLYRKKIKNSIILRTVARLRGHRTAEIHIGTWVQGNLRASPRINIFVSP